MAEEGLERGAVGQENKCPCQGVRQIPEMAMYLFIHARLEFFGFGCIVGAMVGLAAAPGDTVSFPVLGNTHRFSPASY